MSVNQNSAIITAIRQLIEAILKSLGRSNTNRTRHQHVVPHEVGWAVRREGNERITSHHRKQSTAINKARTLAKRHKADVIIHGADGGIRDRISFRD